MRTLFIALFSLTFFAAHAQTPKKAPPPIRVVEKIFNEFVKYGEGLDSDEHKAAMKKAFHALETTVQEKDLQVLINVWMYYDPTDFATGSLMAPIFYKNKAIALRAIDWRLAHKRKWEDRETAPYSDLVNFRKQILNSKDHE